MSRPALPGKRQRIVMTPVSNLFFTLMLPYSMWDERKGLQGKYFHRAAFNLAVLFLIALTV
jgi:hypothetical protein